MLFGLIVGGVALGFNAALNTDINLLYAFVFSGGGYYLGRQEANK